ncbi:hypothetical protein PLESTB_000622000 [Pleodorina starrii]|uniref:Uncharacterized protein n=1 Tax=Pleodorina starrii TaxID=330485 RepID=A0A9W6BIS9_9CHLO|nr:hypothetical protein PLESTM_001730800 [Pleodorina starrii]GLC52372.1 hypothetical protein PLESTB_000622000 [Pleodorina starrii]GLC67960.1 hypothetical protein PLESTF_000628300 [Pleodorina starrii]
MLQAVKDFQLQRIADFTALSAIAQQAWEDRQLPQLGSVPQSALYTAIGILVTAQLFMVLLTRSGRRAIFTTVDTVLAVLLVGILLAAILSLPIGAVYIGVRGSLMMARSLSDNFPALGLVLRPLLAALGQAAAGAAPVAAGSAAAGASPSPNS